MLDRNDPNTPPELVIKMIVDDVEQARRSADQKWGVGRLPALVTEFVRVKFEAQQTLWRETVASGFLVDIKKHADGMRRAYAALDKAATEAGHRPMPPEVWEVPLANDEVLAIVRDDVEIEPALGDGRIVFALSELAELIAFVPDQVLNAKRTIPGSQVVDVRDKPEEGDPDDDIPF